ncbi:MAG: PAS domain S-box protein [Chlorobi bacterium]|nr:PAS domain S-box protein [Chlorobiota bacterium]
MAEQEKNIDQILLENERLKRMIKRISKSAMGMMRAGSSADQPEQSIDFLPIQISSVLMADMPLDKKLMEVLKTLGEYIDVSRVYIFENFDENRKCRNTYEWVNDGVVPQRNKLDDIDYNDYPYWKKILIEKGSIVVSNIREQLPESCWDILESQDILSVIAFPLWVNGEFWGFIGFDECSFEREWIPFEVNILNVTAQLISNAIENQFAQKEIRETIELQELLLDISNLFITSDSFSRQLEKALDTLGHFFKVDRAYVYENSADTGYCTFNTEWHGPDVLPRGDDLRILNYSTDLPGWQTTLLEKGYISTDLYNQEGIIGRSVIFNSGEVASLIVFPIKSQYHFWGFIGFETSKEKREWSSMQRNALETISGILAGAFERRQVNEENRRNHADILKINEQLKEKEGFLSSILSAAPVGISMIKDRKVTFVNDRVVKETGYQKEEIIGKDPVFLYDFDELGKDAIDAFYESIKLKGIGNMEITGITKGGKRIPIQLTGSRAFYGNEDDTFLMISQDISEIKNAEVELIESQNRIKTIIETTIDGILICEKPDVFSYVNKACSKLLGYTLEELNRVPVQRFFTDKREMVKALKAFKQIDENDEYNGEIKIVNRNGEYVYMEVSGTTVMLDNKRQYYFSLHDVTSRIKNSQALQLSEEKFRTLTENSRDHILRIDHTGRISYSNSSFLKEYGFGLSDVIGKTFMEINNIPEEFRRGLWPKISDVLRSGVPENIEIVIHYKGRYLVFDWSITPESNVAGEAHSVLVVGRDYTRRKKAEQELVVAKNKAESADKLKSAFLANMSHEIRTPLNAIVGFANLLKEDFINKEEKEEYINIINKSSDNLMMLINDIIDLARIESGQLNLLRSEVNVHRMLHSLYTTFKQRAKVEKGDAVSIVLSIPPTMSSLNVLADENRLVQIFNNLLGNALKFTSKGYVEFGYTLDENFIRFYVRDTGIGIRQEKHSVIFDQFRQAEEAISKKYGGTGLGLTICKRLVNAMGGEIGIFSEPGEGAEFFFTIPYVPVDQPLDEKPKEKVTIVHHIEPNKKYEWPDKMVLLVDDNSSVHLQLRKYLEKTGITVISARTGSSARELLKKRRDISMVLMDIQMPDVNGVSFIEEMKKQGINVPIIAQTSEDALKNSEEILKAGYDELVSKPINREELLNKMDRFLQGK